jgi:hypothetical protein
LKATETRSTIVVVGLILSPNHFPRDGRLPTNLILSDDGTINLDQKAV